MVRVWVLILMLALHGGASAWLAPAAANDLADWLGCPSRSAAMPVEALCDASGEMPVDTFNTLIARLEHGVNDTSTLCEIDAAVVRAQHDCLLVGTYDPEMFSVGALMAELAHNWARRGELTRADALYRRSTDLLFVDDVIFVDDLDRWANLKLRMGDKQGAREIANLRTSLARLTNKKGGLWPRVLVDALVFEAKILFKTGLLDEARARWREAWVYAGEPPGCIPDPICVSDP